VTEKWPRENLMCGGFTVQTKLVMNVLFKHHDSGIYFFVSDAFFAPFSLTSILLYDGTCSF
jgi:hypothetical protein